MKRKILSALLISFIFATNLIGYANPIKMEDNKISVEAVEDIEEGFKTENGFVNKPKDFEVTTTNDTVVISGTGKENDKVKITLFKREGDSYVLMGEQIELKIGQLGLFTKEVSLKESSTKAPRETVISKDTLIVLQLERGKSSIWDYRLIRFADEKEVKKTLDNLKSNALVINK